MDNNHGNFHPAARTGMKLPSSCAASSRRRFIRICGMGALGCLVSSRGEALEKRNAGKVSLGVITDVHADLQPDAKERLEMFINRCVKENPDFIIQLGDLHHGPSMKKMLEVWNRFPGDKFHVLGNHDMDHKTKWEVVRDQEMPGPYYSFDRGDFHFVVLDANHCMKGGKMFDNNNGNYYRADLRDMVSPEELDWLREDLGKTEKPSVLFSHQAFDDIWQGKTSPSKQDIRKIIREANAGGKKKVIACFCGHHHVDSHMVIEQVHYFQINSASYYWVEESNQFSNGHMAEYKNPLFAFITLDPRARTISVQGVKSRFLPPAPTKKSYARADLLYPGIKTRKVAY